MPDDAIFWIVVFVLIVLAGSAALGKIIEILKEKNNDDQEDK